MKEEKLTFQRDMGAVYHRSILDYGLASRSSISLINDFRVSDDQSLSLDSDHSALVVNFKPVGGASEVVAKQINIYKGIKHWDKFSTILDKRLSNLVEPEFDRWSSREQGTLLTEHFKAVGRSLVASLDPNPTLKNKPKSISKKLQKAMRKVSTVRKQLRRAVERGQVTLALKVLMKEARRELSQAEILERSLVRLKARRILSEGGQKATKMFWQAVSGKKKKLSFISALEGDQGVVYNSTEKKRIIEEFIETKFGTKDHPREEGQPEDSFTEEQLGTRKHVLSDEDASKLIEDLLRRKWIEHYGS